MKKACRESYPGNILDDNSCPGPRYWASVHHMFKGGGRNAKRHDPWTKITSNTEEDLMLAKRAARTPRSEIQTLLDACFDENLELPKQEITGNPWKVHSILESGGSPLAYAGWPTSPAFSSTTTNSSALIRKWFRRSSGLVPLL